MRMKKTIAFLLAAVLVLAASVTVLPSGAEERDAVPALPSLGALPGGVTVLAEYNGIRLSIDAELRLLTVEDLVSGKVWMSGATEDRFDFETAGLSDGNKSNYRSLFSFTYVDVANNRATPQTRYSETENATVIAERIADGTRLTYSFARIGITFTLEFLLEKDGKLIARLPANGIQESGTNVVLTFDMLPFIGAADRFVNGYILVPQGCGALVRFDEYLERPDVAPMEFGVYGRKRVSSWDYWANSATQFGYYDALLPLYGVRHGETAFLAVAENGEFDATISLMPGTDTLPLTYASFRFTQRYQFEVMLSNLSGGNATFATKTDRTRMERDCTVSFTFLNGDDASYSGMARNYRARLLEEGVLSHAALDGEMPLGIEFFMGADEGNRERFVMGNTFVPMTTYSQAAEIVQQLLDLGVNRMDVSLNAWYKGGYGGWRCPPI